MSAIGDRVQLLGDPAYHPVPVRECRARKDTGLYLPTVEQAQEAKRMTESWAAAYGWCQGLCYIFSCIEPYGEASHLDDPVLDPYVWVPKLLRHIGYSEHDRGDFFWTTEAPAGVLARMIACDKIIRFIRGEPT